MNIDGKPSPAERWGSHWINCEICTIGDMPAMDEFCEIGKPLRDAALEDQWNRVRDVVMGER